MNLIGRVIEERNGGERGYATYFRVLKDGIMMLGCGMDENVGKWMV
ncbi:hypothetical protein [Bacillus sp. WP8]|nr:hypothetical protein [Bacillus sp. WP8]